MSFLAAGRVARGPLRGPTSPRGFAVSRERALEALRRFEGLYPLGRSALFIHDNVHHARAAGLALGRLFLEGASSRSWRERQKPFLETRIED
ncbi:hypothetical protein F0U62_27785 [Cystobacter fuscus]|uniref:hypothetical protein n=1 Tax=Cystobacter fuscus TaxID=43 RepID=UPI002B28ECC5|nr:hypothetical protein F0U62_27785 [Cystobacter fuscus]